MVAIIEIPIPVPNMVLSYSFLHDAVLKDCKKHHNTKESRETCYMRYDEARIIKEVQSW